MNFDELNELIPYAKGGKEKVLRMSPYTGVTLAMPGRHWNDTEPKGGDFVVMVDTHIKDHQFKHDDIFSDIETKLHTHRDCTEKLVKYYGAVILGADPLEFDGSLEALRGVGINPYTFLRATQCLAVAEHRRYARFETKVGGRYLPFRFAAGIAEKRWVADEAIALQRTGRPGVEQLEKSRGLPWLTKDLMDALC